jgi:hypothetical protein
MAGICSLHHRHQVPVDASRAAEVSRPMAVTMSRLEAAEAPALAAVAALDLAAKRAAASSSSSSSSSSNSSNSSPSRSVRCQPFSVPVRG